MKIPFVAIGLLVAGLNFSTTAMAQEFVPLGSQLRSELNKRGISYENLQLTQEDQDKLLFWINRNWAARRDTLAYLRDIEDARQREAATGSTLRQIVNRDAEPKELSPREERRLMRALARPRVPDIDYDSLTLEEKRKLLAASHFNDWDFRRDVRSLLASR